MLIRRSKPGDLPEILNIYARAREFMLTEGNPTQWKDWYPPREMVEGDLLPDGHGWVCEDGGELIAVFYFHVEQDPTYSSIEGRWLDEEPYGVVHRIAVKGGQKGVGSFCLNWAYEQCRNLRIDTHADNVPMRHLLGKLGFIYCGIVWVMDGTEERQAFQKTAPAASIQNLA